MTDPTALERRVLSTIDDERDDHIELLQELIRAKPVNPPGNEERAAKIVRPLLQELGFTVEEYTDIEGRPNLVARLEGDGDGPTLLMNAHLDVVPAREPEEWPVDPYSGEIVDGRLYGRGACDHKSPIVAMLGAVRALRENEVTLNGDLLFIFDSNEEKGGEHGMQYVVENADIDPDMGIYAVTTGLTDEAAEYFDEQGRDNIHRANFGNQVYRVTVDGHLEHPLAPAETHSAGARLADLLPHVKAYTDDVKSRSAPLVGTLDAEITTIDSQGRTERAARQMELHVRRYFAPSEDSEEVYDEFVEWVTDAADEEGISEAVSVEKIKDMDTVEVSEDHPLVQATKHAAETVRSREPSIAGIPAQTGITWLVTELNVPMILFGFGNVNFHHAEPEWIDPNDVTDMTQAYALTYMDLLNADDGDA